MIGQYVVGLTLVVNIAMRWPSLIPATLVVAVATGLYGQQEKAAALELAKSAARMEWQMNTMAASPAQPEGLALVPATELRLVHVARGVPD